MAKKNKIYNRFHSEQLNEVIGTPPSWLLKNGITWVFLITLALLGLTYFVHVPERIKSSVIFYKPKLSHIYPSRDQSFVEINFSEDVRYKFKIGQRIELKLDRIVKQKNIYLSGKIDFISDREVGKKLLIVKVLIDKVPKDLRTGILNPINVEVIINNGSLLEKIWKNILKSKKI